MKNLNVMNEQETREVNGGFKYKCSICGFTSGHHFQVYINVLKCKIRTYGRIIGRILIVRR